MDLILETDIGRDADDFFALLYLVNCGVNLRAITVSPGDPDQVTLVKTLLSELNIDIPVGVGKPNRDKHSVCGMHLDFLGKYCSKSYSHDGMGSDIIASTMKSYPDCECLCIGPLNSIGKYLESGGRLGRCTMQGGFVGYNIHEPRVRLEKFEGATSVNTFNLGGDKQSAMAFLNGDVESRRFVGKNVCHTILYGIDEHNRVKNNNSTRAMQLFNEMMAKYLERQPYKAFHDPTAACCHLHPEIGEWIQGKLVYGQGKWGATTIVPEEQCDLLLVDIDRDKLWNYFELGK